MNLLDDIMELVRKTRIEDWKILEGDQGCFVHKSTGLILKKSITKTALRAGDSYKYSIGRVKQNASYKASGKSDTFYTGDKAEEMFDLVQNAYFEAKDYKKKEGAILKLITDLGYSTSFSF